MDNHKRTCAICRSRPAFYLDDDLCDVCARALYADVDMDEPDRYYDGEGETDDDRYNDPRTGQADEINSHRRR